MSTIREMFFQLLSNKGGDESEMQGKQNNQQEQEKGVLSADGILISEVGVDILIMILFDDSAVEIKKSGIADFAERIVRNFIKANTKEDIDKFIKCGTMSKFIDILRH